MENPNDLLNDGKEISEGIKQILQLQEGYIDALQLISELERRDIKVDQLPMQQLERMEELFETLSPGRGSQIVAFLKHRHKVEAPKDYTLAHAQLLADIHKAVKAPAKVGMSDREIRRRFEKRFLKRIDLVDKMYPEVPEKLKDIIPYRRIGRSTASPIIISQN